MRFISSALSFALGGAIIDWHHSSDKTTPMRREDLRKLADGTSDAAFVVDSDGLIVAWNASAQRLFGVPAADAIGQPCRTIVHGLDEGGAVCSRNCTVHQAIERQHTLETFDLQVESVDGQKWCNMSVVIVESDRSIGCDALHIIRPVDLRKRLEMMVRDFIVSNTTISADQALAMIDSRPAASESELSEREIEILRALAEGKTTRHIAAELHISRNTVNNHVQHILQKLDSHTRLQAIRRAENARLI